VQGETTLKKAISSTVVSVYGDANLATPLMATTEVLLIQVQTNDVYLTLHGDTPAAGTGILIAFNSILEMSTSQWLASKWVRASADATLVAFQMRAS
jgi:hypothetical protein